MPVIFVQGHALFGECAGSTPRSSPPRST